MTQLPKIRRVAVLGAGVMGAQIAAHFVNAGFPVDLYDLETKGDDPNALVNRSLAALQKLKPSPLATADVTQHIHAGNYAQDLPRLAQCDLVIEAIAERMDWKQDLFAKIAPHLAAHCIVASNTSGLGINALADTLTAVQRKRFCGIHFFNPPRYMPLVELIPAKDTEQDVLTVLETFLVSKLGKTVVYAKDTPNFIANRIGVFSILATLHYAEKLNIGFDIVDALTGPAIGRPKSATLRTADVVGLDVLAHTIQTMKKGLPDDPWHDLFVTPDWLQGLIDKGSLGQKTQRGVYQKIGKDIVVYDLKGEDYRPATAKPSAAVLAMLKVKDPHQRLHAFRHSDEPEAQFLWSIFREVFHYASVHAASIADTLRDIDLALRAGFGWKEGPFETWQQADWKQVTAWILEDVQQGKTLSRAPLPAWVTEQAAVYTEKGSYSPNSQMFKPRKSLPVYKKQAYPTACLAEVYDEGHTIHETPAVRLWHTGDDVAILSFKTKMCAVSNAVLDGIRESVALAEANYKGLVIWQRHSEHFCAGADLNGFLEVIREGNFTKLNQTLDDFQHTCLALRNATIPAVAAVSGYVLGGGCELMMHCDRVVAALESYIGLVEVGVGLLPAGGGCKEMFLRASEKAKRDNLDPYYWVEKYFKQIAMGTVSTSAREAFSMGYLRERDVVILQPAELLHAAKQIVHAFDEIGYASPLRIQTEALGSAGVARLECMLVNMREGGWISDHDMAIALRVAGVLCGGAVDSGSQVDDAWLLRLEREAFCALAGTSKTLDRIDYMLKNGKPLRN